MRYVGIVELMAGGTLLLGRETSLQAARQGIADARGICESAPDADHDAWSSRRGEPARVTAQFGTPRTMTVRLVADIQNRLVWRVGTGRASERCVPSAGWS
jgi:hypothetical protein